MNKTQTILICNQKGGVGKTLVADELAFGFDRKGIPYNLYDLDRQGGSVHKEVRNDNAVVNIVDTPGALQKDLVKWMINADLIIIPTKMTPRDLQPLITMFDLIKQNKVEAPVFCVFNEWNRYNAAKEFEEWFMSTYPTVRYRIPRSEGFTQAALDGVSIFNLSKYKKSFAADQLKALIRDVIELLSLEGEAE